MRKKNLMSSAVLLISLGLTGLQAQEAIPASGGNASGSGGTSNYTVGQIVYTTNTGTNGSVAQGVQQPYEISVVSGIEQAIGINPECTVYPNPTTDYLTLKIDGDVQTRHALSQQALSYQLYDINGKLLENKKMTGGETNIDMNGFTPSTYFLKVFSNNQEIKTFKIIKN